MKDKKIRLFITREEIFLAAVLLVFLFSHGLSAQDAAQIPQGIHGSFDFEGVRTEDKIPWSGYEKTPVNVLSDGGAVGGFYLRTGPVATRFIGAIYRVPFTMGENSWVGFSARTPGGGSLSLLTFDTKRKHNVSRSVSLPKDGSWATFLIPLHWLDIEPGTRLRDIRFFLGNPNQEELCFDLDNVVVGTGTDTPLAKAVSDLRAEFKNDKAYLSWQAPASIAGIYRYRIYRGLHSDFPRNEKHRYAETDSNNFTDSAFAHVGEYFYTVRVLDFAGNEGPDSGAVKFSIESSKNPKE